MQEEVRQKLIDEPLVEHQEQYKEDLVEPMSREDAVTLTRLLATSLPPGAIQVGCSALGCTTRPDWGPSWGLASGFVCGHDGSCLTLGKYVWGPLNKIAFAHLSLISIPHDT